MAEARAVKLGDYIKSCQRDDKSPLKWMTQFCMCNCGL